jgi:hypothetical protein
VLTDFFSGQELDQVKQRELMGLHVTPSTLTAPSIKALRQSQSFTESKSVVSAKMRRVDMTAMQKLAHKLDGSPAGPRGSVGRENGKNREMPKLGLFQRESPLPSEKGRGRRKPHPGVRT